jgi:peroxiredoxin
MKPRSIALTSLLVLGLAAIASHTSRADGIAIGDPAPKADVAMKNIDGKDVTIAGLKGEKGTLVVFTCNHCPWAKAWETRIVDLGNSYRKRGIGVVAINSNDPEAYPEDGYADMQKRAKQRKIMYAYAVDATSEIARAFGATHTPEAFIFDREGKLVYHGGIDDNAKEPQRVKQRWLRDALDAVIAGKAVALAETKAMGCGIKFRNGAS